MSPLPGRPLYILREYNRAVVAKDVDALAELYTEDAIVYDAWDKWEYRGEENRKRIEAWFTSLGSTRDNPQFFDWHIIESEETATIHAYVVYINEDENAQRLRSIRNRVTFGMVKRGDSWKIAHEHTSIPVRSEGFGGIYQEE